MRRCPELGARTSRPALGFLPSGLTPATLLPVHSLRCRPMNSRGESRSLSYATGPAAGAGARRGRDLSEGRRDELRSSRSRAHEAAASSTARLSNVPLPSPSPSVHLSAGGLWSKGPAVAEGSLSLRPRWAFPPLPPQRLPAPCPSTVPRPTPTSELTLLRSPPPRRDRTGRLVHHLDERADDDDRAALQRRRVGLVVAGDRAQAHVLLVRRPRLLTSEPLPLRRLAAHQPPDVHRIRRPGSTTRIGRPGARPTPTMRRRRRCTPTSAPACSTTPSKGSTRASLPTARRARASRTR